MPIEANVGVPESNVEKPLLTQSTDNNLDLGGKNNQTLDFSPLSQEDGNMLLAQHKPDQNLKPENTSVEEQLNVDKIPNLSLNSSPDTDKDSKPSSVIEIAELDYNQQTRSVLDRLAITARRSVDKWELGNKVPSKASDFANYKVPNGVQCASTMSDMFMESGIMDAQDYKIRVKDLIPYMSKELGKPQALKGDFDINNFPEGAIGVITGTGHYRNGTNHVGFVEREGNDVFIIHNKNGKVVREDIKNKFYNSKGKPKYRNLKLFKMN